MKVDTSEDSLQVAFSSPAFELYIAKIPSTKLGRVEDFSARELENFLDHYEIEWDVLPILRVSDETRVIVQPTGSTADTEFLITDGPRTDDRGPVDWRAYAAAREDESVVLSAHSYVNYEVYEWPGLGAFDPADLCLATGTIDIFGGLTEQSREPFRLVLGVTYGGVEGRRSHAEGEPKGGYFNEIYAVMNGLSVMPIYEVPYPEEEDLEE